MDQDRKTGWVNPADSKDHDAIDDAITFVNGGTETDPQKLDVLVKEVFKDRGARTADKWVAGLHLRGIKPEKQTT